MTTPVSRMAYEECYDILDRAMESERGIQILYDKKGDALHFRVMLCAARDQDRKNNGRVYQPGDPLYRQTLYSKLRIRMPIFDEERNKWVLRLGKDVIEDMEIEEIPAPERAVIEPNEKLVTYEEVEAALEEREIDETL